MKSIYFTGFRESKFVSRFCVKSLILPLRLERLIFGASNGYRANTKVVGNDEISQTEIKWEFLGITKNLPTLTTQDKWDPTVTN